MAKSQEDLEKKILTKVAAIDWRKWKKTKDKSYKTNLGDFQFEITRNILTDSDYPDTVTDILRVYDTKADVENIEIRNVHGDDNYSRITKIYENIYNKIEEDKNRKQQQKKYFSMNKLKKALGE
jgi:hypothetical protein